MRINLGKDASSNLFIRQILASATQAAKQIKYRSLRNVRRAIADQSGRAQLYRPLPTLTFAMQECEP